MEDMAKSISTAGPKDRAVTETELVGRKPAATAGVAAAVVAAAGVAAAAASPYLRAANEDDDGYDPYSDRRPEPEPMFERDPWR